MVNLMENIFSKFQSEIQTYVLRDYFKRISLEKLFVMFLKCCVQDCGETISKSFR